MLFSGIFAIAVGLSMFGLRVGSLIRKQAPDFETDPYRIWLHPAGEFSTAAIAGTGLLTGQHGAQIST